MAEGTPLQAFGFGFSANPMTPALLPATEFTGTMESSCMENDFHPKMVERNKFMLKSISFSYLETLLTQNLPLISDKEAQMRHYCGAVFAISS